MAESASTAQPVLKELGQHCCALGSIGTIAAVGAVCLVMAAVPGIAASDLGTRAAIHLAGRIETHRESAVLPMSSRNAACQLIAVVTAGHTAGWDHDTAAAIAGCSSSNPFCGR